MKILGIETSCDETAVCLIDCEGSFENGDLRIEVLGDALRSQIELHKEFGGVVPMMAKREHAKNLIPLFLNVLKSFDVILDLIGDPVKLTALQEQKLTDIFGRETEFRNEFIKMFMSMGTIDIIDIKAIAVTEGPGLEPALWMGIIFAQALSHIFDIPLIPINHMEGHILSALVGNKSPSSVSMVPFDTYLERRIEFPLIALLISGGHTELVLMDDWNSYKVVGETRDDAVGEAFDKVARMLDLPYPGGPEISRLAESGRMRIKNSDLTKTSTPKYILPRPMIRSGDLDFSFSGIKTAVLYSLKNDADKKELSKETISLEFEEAVTDVLVSKTLEAIEKFNAKSLVLGGGVVSNSFIRRRFEEELGKMQDVSLFIPDTKLRTDNALMIAIAGYQRLKMGLEKRILKANGTMRLGN